MSSRPSYHWGSPFCERCQRSFRLESDWDAHRWNSTAHNYCNLCDFPYEPDFQNYDQLMEHKEMAHNYCTLCHDDFHSPQALEKHQVYEHNMCLTCGNTYDTPNSLQQHEYTHQPRNLECCGCRQMFKSFSGMLLHLETGYCPSQIGAEDINEVAFRCYQKKRYATDLRDDFPYFCPSCGHEFSKASGLFQHVENTGRCAVNLEPYGYLSKLQRFLMRQL